MPPFEILEAAGKKVGNKLGEAFLPKLLDDQDLHLVDCHIGLEEHSIRVAVTAVLIAVLAVCVGSTVTRVGLKWHPATLALPFCVHLALPFLSD
jgi:hypothetical protein